MRQGKRGGRGGASFEKPLSAMMKASAFLSFADDVEDDEDGNSGGLKTLKSKKKNKKAFASKKSLQRALEEHLDEKAAVEGIASANQAGGVSYSGGGGEYSKEKLAELKKVQNFQVSIKASRTTEAKARVAFEVPEDTDGEKEDAEGVDTEDYDVHSAQLEQLKKGKRRRGMLGSGNGLGAEEGMDFISLEASGEGGTMSWSGKGAARRLDSISEADPRIDKDWESEVIRRGVRTGRGETSDGRSMALEGRGARDLSLTSSLSSMALPSKGLKDSEFKSVETVLADMRSVQSRLEESHDRNSRTAEKTRSEVASVKDGLEKMQKEFGGTAARFEYFQDVRIFLSSLCGCLREKEAMVRELEAAMAQLWREGYERRMSRRVQDQEDALEEALETDGKEQQSSQAGMLLSLQGYAPEVVIALKESLSKGAGVPGPAHHDLDEFGRDASGEMSKDRRRRERRGRLASVLERINDGTGGDKAEAEATFSGAEESDSGVETLRTRQAKLLEAAGVIFEDVADEFKALDAVVQRFEDWKRKFPKDYHTAYVPIALPQVLEPYVRVEMVTWNPLGPVRSMEDGDGAGGKDVGGAAIEAFPWFERLFEYGQFQEEGSAPKQEGEDPDDRLVPQLVEKVAVNRLEGLLNECYDPFSERETQRAISAIQGLLIYEPGKHALESLLRAPFSRLEKAITKLCLPLLGPEAGISLWEFQRRQIFVALKLFRNVCFWHQVLAPRPLASLVLGVLLDGKLASALENRLDNTGRGILSKSKTVLEVIGTLEALMIATPSALVVSGDGVRLLGMGRLLDKLETRELAGPLSSTVKRVRLGFGKAIKTPQKVK